MPHPLRLNQGTCLHKHVDYHIAEEPHYLQQFTHMTCKHAILGMELDPLRKQSPPFMKLE
jgi:hypothetical protein